MTHLIKVLFIVLISKTIFAADLPKPLQFGSRHLIRLIQVGKNTYSEKEATDQREDFAHEYGIALRLNEFQELSGWFAKAIERTYLEDQHKNFHSWILWTRAYPSGSLAHIITKYTKSFPQQEAYSFYSEWENYLGDKNYPAMDLDAARFYLANAGLLIHKLHSAGFLWGNIKPESLALADDGYLEASNFVLSKPLTDHATSDWVMLGNRVGIYGFRLKDDLNVKALVRGQINNFEEFKKLPLFIGFDWEKLEQRKLRAPFLAYVETLAQEHFKELLYINTSDIYKGGVNGSVSLLKIGKNLFAEKVCEKQFTNLKFEFEIAQSFLDKPFMTGWYAKAHSITKRIKRSEKVNYFFGPFSSMMMDAYTRGSLADIVSRFTHKYMKDELRGADGLTFSGEDKTYEYTEYETENQKAVLKLPILPTEALRFYLANIALLISKLHQAGVAWADTKAENMLVDFDGYLIAADFGISNKFAELNEFERNQKSKQDWLDLGRRVGLYAFRLDERRRTDDNSQVLDVVTALRKGQINSLDDFKLLKPYKDFDWSALESRTMPAPQL